MVRSKTRLLVGIHMAVDLCATAVAWLLAYYLRFEAPFVSGLVPALKGHPGPEMYLEILPLIVILWPGVLYFHGSYRLKRERSRIDEAFTVASSVVLASLLTLGLTLYIRVYYRYQPDVAPSWEFSQAVFALFGVLDIALILMGRAALRAWLERRWAAGDNVCRVAIAGTGDLAQSVADAIIAHRALGFRLVGFLAEEPSAEVIGGLPVLGSIDSASELIRAHSIDQVYLALPLHAHARIVSLIRDLANECVDIKVVPDLMQYAAVKATMEDLDGIPIITLNELPLSGWSSMVKRLMDITMAATALLLLTLIPVFPLIALLIWRKGGKGPILLRQERMTLDGKTFEIFKFRTMVDEAERDTGPVFATSDDPRRTPVGAFLRKYNLDELPQIANVLLGHMSLVGPRPERPPFVQQFRERIPRYMRRHRVKSGITGWAQVNGWRGNTSIEKRIEFDLYYIENWSLLLDLKILILTLFKGFGQDHAY